MSEFDILGHSGLMRIRVNIANAAVFGMKDELGLVGSEYNIALVILFVRSFGCAFPCVHLSAKLRPVHHLRDPRKLLTQKVQTACLA